MKEIKNYLHLYKDCECVPDRSSDWNEKDCGKPILRPLMDMGNEEQAFFGCPDDYFDYMKKMEHQIIYLHSDEFIYLLSRHFDLFGLIEAGIAIDKSTIKTTTT